VRKAILVLATVAVLGAVNWTIAARERLIESGRVVLLELAPVDPRSLMQGDYMALRFKVADEAFPGRRVRDTGVGKAEDGRIVVTLDERGVGSFKRLAGDAPLAANEALLRYRVRDGIPKFATNAFFFQEGHAKHYERARYGEFRVGSDGDAILSGLRGEKLERLAPPASR
jgi:uncharacterized membrane-anchored protein